MVSIGGLVANMSIEVSSDGWEITDYDNLPDPWLQGLGILDLTAMEWKEEYDTTAAPYVTPDAVKAYYQRNGRGPASWTNDIVRAWFTEATSYHTDSGNHTDSSNHANPSNHADSNNHTDSSNPRDSNSTPSIPQPGRSGLPGSSESNISVIAGGAVGGVVALAFIALGALFLMRCHRRRDRWTVPSSDIRYRIPEMENNGNGRIPGISYQLCELQGINDPVEVPAREVAATELPG